MVSNSNINPKNIVIIGASHAGLSCAEKLRQLDFKVQIVIVEKLDGFPIGYTFRDGLETVNWNGDIPNNRK